jgi:assimilatory nitrate reductase catalytic subunit
MDGGKVVSFLPTKGYPVNLGKSCPKGFHLLKPFDSPDRALKPLLRDFSGRMNEVSWEVALETFVSRFKAIKEKYGMDSIAFLSTGQMPTEEMAFLGALFKFGMGLIHADGNTRQCMATAAVAYKQAFGFDAPPFSYKDFEESDLLIFVGANPAIAHPVMWNRVKMNKNNPKIVVIDPRRTRTAEESDVHLAVNSKGDLDLLYSIARVLVDRDWVDRKYIETHTIGFEEFKAHLSGYSAADVESRTGITPAEVENLARMIHEAKAVSLWWTMGVNQSHQGVRTAQAIINIALITGNIGRPGTGPNSITGQANAMGSRLFSNTTSLFAGYDVLKDEDRRRIAEILDIPLKAIPDRNGMPYHKILEAVQNGTIKGLWVIATNPAHSWIDRNTLYEKLGKLDFLVVQDLFTTTETAGFAHLMLPAAGSGEKTGTVINSERRLGIIDKISEPPGEARSDFDIFRGIADAWGCGEMFRRWTDPEAVFKIIREVTAGRPCDFTGISGYDMIRSGGGVQWPYGAASADDAVERRLFADGRFYTPDGRARIIFDISHDVPEAVDDEYPVELLTGRGSVAQFHTQTRTGQVEMLNRISRSRCYVEVNPGDAAGWGLAEGDEVEVSSRRGSVIVETVISDGLKPGQVFMPMHYEETNRLTFPAFDPQSSEPAYKHAAVKLRRAGTENSGK